MIESKHQIITFPSTQFKFTNKKLFKHSLVIIGIDLSKSKIEKEIKKWDSDYNFQHSQDFFLTNNIVSIGLLKNKNVSTFQKELSIIEQKLDFHKSHFSVLLDYEVPSRYISIEQRPSEESFLISPNTFFDFYKANIVTGLCYHLMLKALDHKNKINQLLVHQIGHPNHIISNISNQPESAEVIMPHRGSLEELNDLESSLWHLENQLVSPQKVSVCFDEFVTEHHFKIADEHKTSKFYVNFPSGIGPYPSRDKLARATEEEMIIFHDSDDVSTIDRIAMVTNALKNENLDAVGCHELRVNKIDKRIEAIRFPIDVIGVNKKEEWHSIFFPTTAIKKSAYLKIGGLSTIRRHSSDSQFYWRAHFFLNIKNIDDFLYIRVKRENSLTTASSTALGSIVRERLRRQWRTDFLKIKYRNISLLESTLVDEYNVAEIDLISLEKQHRELILNWQEMKINIQKNSLTNTLNPPQFPNENDILEDRVLEYSMIKDPGVNELKRSLSWRIGWAITRVIIFLFGWIPFVKKRL